MSAIRRARAARRCNSYASRGPAARGARAPVNGWPWDQGSAVCECVEIISCDKRRKHTSSKDRTGLKSGMRRPAWSWWCIQSPSSLTSVVLSAVVFCCSGGRGAKPPVAGPSAAVGLSKYVCDPWRCGRAESQCTGVSQCRRKRE